MNCILFYFLPIYVGVLLEFFIFFFFFYFCKYSIIGAFYNFWYCLISFYSLFILVRIYAYFYFLDICNYMSCSKSWIFSSQVDADLHAEGVAPLLKVQADRGAPGGPHPSPFPSFRCQAPVWEVRMPWGRDWPACLSVGVSKGADVLLVLLLWGKTIIRGLNSAS